MSYLEQYLERIRKMGNNSLAEAVQKTAADIAPQYISHFSFTDHVVSLLAGDVQSGKTSHMFGLACAAADEDFRIFIILTTDNTLLQQQTLERAKKDLPGFCVCGENDYLLLQKDRLRRPAAVVLKKNASVLRTWKNNLDSLKICKGNPLFLIDDEGDAASLNTKVNQRKTSTIYRTLHDIQQASSGSICMEVTGTPQALLLQTEKSGSKPYFIYYFKPGKGYLGGDFFFPEEVPKQVILTDEEEAGDILIDDELPENGLKKALLMHLVTAGQVMLSGGTVCNFLIHPGVRTKLHEAFSDKVGRYLNEIYYAGKERETVQSFQEAYDNLKTTKEDMLPFEEIYRFIMDKIQGGQIGKYLLNSHASYKENTRYGKGINIICGGNSLGRGVTFPCLQTVYYCRTSKRPQADTMWQHARMFGYDRDPGLMRVCMPPRLFKFFSDINKTNRSIIRQIESIEKGGDIKIFYPEGLKPTRNNVLDKKAVRVFSGGVNYFPFSPAASDTAEIDRVLQPFGDDIYPVSIKLLICLIENETSESGDWDGSVFAGFLKALIKADPGAQGKLIISRNRDIGRGTGTLLSPQDRALGDHYSCEPVLTMYRITGRKEKGWDGRPRWIPNIKLPGDVSYYCGEAD